MPTRPACRSPLLRSPASPERGANCGNEKRGPGPRFFYLGHRFQSPSTSSTLSRCVQKTKARLSVSRLRRVHRRRHRVRAAACAAPGRTSLRSLRLLPRRRRLPVNSSSCFQPYQRKCAPSTCNERIRRRRAEEAFPAYADTAATKRRPSRSAFSQTSTWRTTSCDSAGGGRVGRGSSFGRGSGSSHGGLGRGSCLGGRSASDVEEGGGGDEGEQGGRLHGHDLKLPRRAVVERTAATDDGAVPQRRQGWRGTGQKTRRPVASSLTVRIIRYATEIKHSDDVKARESFPVSSTGTFPDAAVGRVAQRHRGSSS